MEAGRAGGQVAAAGRWREGEGGLQTGSDNKRRETAIRHFGKQPERVSDYWIGGGDRTEDF